MAKRKRKDKEEEENKAFKMPKFDKEKFLTKERRNIKVTIWSVIFGFLMAFICTGFWILMGPNDSLRWPLVVLVMLANAVFLRYVFNWRKLDISDFTKKNWFSSYGTYVFSWLILFIVLVNPPIYDGEAPRVDFVVMPKMQEFGGTVQLVAKITDNSAIEKSGITLTIDGTTIDPDNYSFKDNIFRYVYENDSIENVTTISYNLVVKDKAGWETKRSGNFTYSDTTIYVPEPLGADNESNRPLISYSTDIKIEVNTDVDRVYYTLNDGEPINVTTLSSDGKYYITRPEVKGWPKNTNVTMKVFAEKYYFFKLVVDKPTSQMSENELREYVKKQNENSVNATIADTQEYYFKVKGDPKVGTEEPPEVKIYAPSPVQVPGFEAIIFIIALIAVVLIFKYRKKDRR